MGFLCKYNPKVHKIIFYFVGYSISWIFFNVTTDEDYSTLNVLQKYRKKCKKH